MGMENPNKLTVHCTGTEPMYDIGLEEIKLLHTYEEGKPLKWCGKDLFGNGWSDVGYHRIIRRDGTIEAGRPLSIQGAHVLGHNPNNFAVCLVGGGEADNKTDCNYTHWQWTSLLSLCRWFDDTYGPLVVLGHRDYTDKKDCPCFNVPAWWNGGRYNGPV